MEKSIYIIHPVITVSKALVQVVRTYCNDVLNKRGWQDLPIREISSIDEIIPFKEKDNVKLLITHLERVSPDSRDIASIRHLRMDGMRSPLIAMSFSKRNAHRIFSAEKAHALFVYPFHIDTFRKTFLTIKSLNPGDMGYIREQFCDEDYRETLRNMILHAVAHRKWEKVESYFDKFEQSFGKNTEIRKLLEGKEEKISSWDGLF